MKARENLKLKTRNLKMRQGFTLLKKEQTGFTLSKEEQTGFTLLKKEQTGFTLIELIIYIGLLMVMLLMFSEILTTILENQIRSTSTSNIADDGRYIYSRLIYDIGRAEEILEPSFFGSTSARLELQIEGNTSTYSASGGTLLLTDSIGSDSLSGYGTTISDLQFTKVGSSSASETVQINFTVSSNIEREAALGAQTFQTTVGLR